MAESADLAQCLFCGFLKVKFRQESPNLIK